MKLEKSIWRNPKTVFDAWNQPWQADDILELIAEGTVLHSKVHKRLVSFACDCVALGLSNVDDLAVELNEVLDGTKKWIVGEASSNDVTALAEKAYQLSVSIGPDGPSFGILMADAERRQRNYLCNAVHSAAETVDYPPNAPHVVRWIVSATIQRSERQPIQLRLSAAVKESFDPTDVLYGQRANLELQTSGESELLKAALDSPDEAGKWYSLANWLEENGDDQFESVRAIGRKLDA